MHILCTICNQTIHPEEGVDVTKCGHLFHRHCLSQSIERSRTCPQCCSELTDSCIWRMHPIAATTEPCARVGEIMAKFDILKLTVIDLKKQWLAIINNTDSLKESAVCEHVTPVHAQSSNVIAESLRTCLKNLPATLDVLKAFSQAGTSKSALVILAQGAEEMETAITVSMLRRTNVAVTLAGLDGSSPVLCARGVTMSPDKSLADALADTPQYDAVILPGGLEGSERLSESDVVGTILKEQEKSGRILAALCDGPMVFAAHRVGLGKRITGSPIAEGKMVGYTFEKDERVVADGNFVTGRGAISTFFFVGQLMEALAGKEIVQEMIISE